MAELNKQNEGSNDRLIDEIRALRVALVQMSRGVDPHVYAAAKQVLAQAGDEFPGNREMNNTQYLSTLIAGEVVSAMADGCDVEEAAKRAAQAYRDGLDCTFGYVQRGTPHLTLAISRALRKVACAVPEGTADKVPALLPQNPALPSRAEEWRIEIKGDRFLFTRWVAGMQAEAYCPVSGGMASVFAIAVIQGFEPPRALHYSDRPPARKGKAQCAPPKP